MKVEGLWAQITPPERRVNCLHCWKNGEGRKKIKKLKGFPRDDVSWLKKSCSMRIFSFPLNSIYIPLHTHPPWLLRLMSFLIPYTFPLPTQTILDSFARITINSIYTPSHTHTPSLTPSPNVPFNSIYIPPPHTHPLPGKETDEWWD